MFDALGYSRSSIQGTADLAILMNKHSDHDHFTVSST
jgi:hypothetical protein